jgi:hypothetical protein
MALRVFRTVPVLIMIFLFIGFASLVVGAEATAQWAWQNPALAPNPWSNIHNDSWFTDTYTVPGPAPAQRVETQLFSEVSFKDPETGKVVEKRLATCAAHTYDARGDLVTVCSSWPDLVRRETTWSIVAIDPEGQVAAYHGIVMPYTSLAELFTDFGGIGYFYADAQERIVLGMPNGHIVTWRREPSTVNGVDRFVVDRDVDIADDDGPLVGKKLYALMPNEAGYVWFTTTAGDVGTVAPQPCESGCVRWIDLNDPDGDGVPDPQPDGRLQRISESHSVNGLSTFQQTDYNMYRLDMQPDGTPEIAWRRRYLRGRQVKPGQTSQGSGTSPVYFELGGREFVTIMDNARKPHIDVYRAERNLQPGESRLFAQAAPFGGRTRVSDENSLIVYPGRTGRSIRIYAENNWGNSSLLSTIGPLVTRSGFGGIEVFEDGRVRVLSPNQRIRVPSVVSKGNIPDEALYTYEKRISGWYITALDPDDLHRELWSARIGGGRVIWNSWYAQLSQSPDGRSFWIANLRITPVEGPALPSVCASIRDPSDFVDVVGQLGEFTGGEIYYPEWLRAFVLGSVFGFAELSHALARDRGLASSLDALRVDLWTTIRILSRARYDANALTSAQKERLRTIASRHDDLLGALGASGDDLCGP